VLLVVVAEAELLVAVPFPAAADPYDAEDAVATIASAVEVVLPLEVEVVLLLEVELAIGTVEFEVEDEDELPPPIRRDPKFDKAAALAGTEVPGFASSVSSGPD